MDLSAAQTHIASPPSDGHRRWRDRLHTVVDSRAEQSPHRAGKSTLPGPGTSSRVAGHLTARGRAVRPHRRRAAHRRPGHRLDRPGPGGAPICGAASAARVALFAGMMATLISLLQFVLGMILARTASPGTAHLLYDTVNRLDGVEIFTLSVLGLAGAVSGVLPRWLRFTGIALAVAIAASGLAYLLLLPGLALVPGRTLVLLLLLPSPVPALPWARPRRTGHGNGASSSGSGAAGGLPGRRTRPLAVLGAAAAALAVWAVAGPLASTLIFWSRLAPPAVQHVSPATVAIVSILAGLAAWALLALLERFTPRPRPSGPP